MPNLAQQAKKARAALLKAEKDKEKEVERHESARSREQTEYANGQFEKLLAKSVDLASKDHAKTIKVPITENGWFKEFTPVAEKLCKRLKKEGFKNPHIDFVSGKVKYSDDTPEQDYRDMYVVFEI